MSAPNTPASPAQETPFSVLSSFTAKSNPATPQSFRIGHGTPSPIPSTSRRSGGSSSHILSMYSTQDRVVLQIGARFVRAGFSGNAFPLCCIDATDKSDKEVFWEAENWDAGLVEDRIERALREVYTQYESLGEELLMQILISRLQGSKCVDFRTDAVTLSDKRRYLSSAIYLFSSP